MTSIEFLKVALSKFIAILMMSANLAAPGLLKRTALMDKSSYILLVKYVPFCHTTEVYTIKNILKFCHEIDKAILIYWYITLTHFCSMPPKNITLKWGSIKDTRKTAAMHLRAIVSGL